MENTLLVGDHLVVDHLTLAPPAKWMPLVHYREPHRGDIVVFFKPVFQPGLDQLDGDGKPKYTILVKRLIGVPGDHIHLHNGIVILNGVAQPQPYAQPTTPDNYQRISRRVSLRCRRTRSQAAPPRLGPLTFPTTLSMAIWWFLPACTS